jgi:hypothetical protein
LDTSIKRAAWHKDINFDIKKWIILDDKGKSITRDTLLHAFKYDKRSAVVKASFKSNVFTVETSDVKSFTILLSPEMVNLNKPISVIVNGRLYVTQNARYDKDFMLADFRANSDRLVIWVNHIDVYLP